MIDFTIKQGDRLPILQATFNDTNGPVNLSGAQVDFYYKVRGSDSVPTSGTATVTDAANGIVQYAWSGNETNSAGIYVGEFVTTYTDGRQISFPSDSFLVFEIVKDIN